MISKNYDYKGFPIAEVSRKSLFLIKRQFQLFFHRRNFGKFFGPAIAALKISLYDVQDDVCLSGLMSLRGIKNDRGQVLRSKRQ